MRDWEVLEVGFRRISSLAAGGKQKGVKGDEEGMHRLRVNCRTRMLSRNDSRHAVEDSIWGRREISRKRSEGGLAVQMGLVPPETEALFLGAS